MKTIYVCEICGLTSENKEEIRECEKQGLPQSKFSCKQKVEYNYPTEGKWIKAEVLSVVIGGGDHRVYYNLLKSDRRIPFAKRIKTVPEKYIRLTK